TWFPPSPQTARSRFGCGFSPCFCFSGRRESQSSHSRIAIREKGEFIFGPSAFSAIFTDFCRGGVTGRIMSFTCLRCCFTLLVSRYSLRGRARRTWLTHRALRLLQPLRCWHFWLCSMC